MSRLVSYDSDEVHTLVSGFPITDLRAATFFNMTQRNDRYTELEGADGGVVRNATHSKIYDLTFTLLGGSSANSFLSALMVADAAQLNGQGIVSFLMKDNNGDTLYTTDKCYVKKAPDNSFGVERDDVAWNLVLVMEPAQVFVGGNG